MYKKIFIAFILLSSVSLFSCICLATDSNTMNSISNTVNDGKNSTQGAIENITNTTKNVTAGMQNSVTNSMSGNTMYSNNNYNAVRTSTATTATFWGMNATTWTWLILGIAAIAIIALVWYYSAQSKKNYDSDE